MTVRTTNHYPVLVGVDGSDDATAAVRWAAHAAVLHSAQLHVVAAVESAASSSAYLPIPPTYFSDLEHGAEADLAVAADVAGVVAKGEDVDLVVKTELARGNPRYQLAELSRRAQTIVVGRRGAHHAAGLGAIGSMPWTLAGHAHCPVAVIQDGQPSATHRPPRVVVGVDGSPECELAVSTAFAEAELRDATLVAVHAWNSAYTDSALDPLHASAWRQATRGESVVLSEMLAGYRDDYPDVKVEQRIVDDLPAVGLAAAAASADLLIVGSRGRGGWKSVLLGSTSHRLLSTAECPLLITRQ